MRADQRDKKPSRRGQESTGNARGRGRQRVGSVALPKDRNSKEPGSKKGSRRPVRRVAAEEQVIEKKRERRGNSQILILTYSLVLIFMGLVGYFTYFMVAQSQQIINNPYNKRQEVLAKKVQRGKILSADGKTLAKTVTDDEGNDTRIYPYDEIFCHVVGRIQNSMTGIEKNQCYPLLTSHSNPLKQLTNTFRGEKNQGDTVITTLDADLQRAAYNALGSHKGAVVALEPSTGKILAMVSKPAYNPNSVVKNWDKLVKDSDEESALVNRATQGLYPPGSTFKLLTAMEYMIENPDTYQNFRYRCTGSDSFSGNVINCYDKEKHGRLSLKSSLAKSCNGAFAEIGTKLDINSFRGLAEKFQFNKELGVDFEYNQSKFSLTKDSDMGELTQTVIGQGKTMITPLENAMIASTIANNGVMMTPYVVDHLENDGEKLVKSYASKSEGRIVDEWVAQKMTKLMKAVVTDGTGSSLNSLPYSVAGKTGSAEFDSEGTSHAWFVGFAPADAPKIVVSIVVEGAGTGSQYAVPIAKKMFANYLSK